MSAPFEVLPFNLATLRRVMAEKSGADSSVVDSKSHGDYFAEYFAHFNARTIVVENEYIDRDFLEDFAAYYVRCFHDYGRKCSRLHFFGRDVSADDLASLISGEAGPLTRDDLQEAYLGFVVMKPLPQTIVGRTCLRTYEEMDGRCYPIKRPYRANLFGLELEVETLAFQEQDRVVAACATSALWSVFNGTGILFQHAIPSPVEITRAASLNSWSDTRNLPNDGLTMEQMARAVRSVGLEPYKIDVQEEFILKSTVYAYLRGGVPVMLGIGLYDAATTPAIFMGQHAVAVTGFRIDQAASASGAAAAFSLRASKIDRLYAHDDGVGPFAKMVFDGRQVTVDRSSSPRMSLSTSWKNDRGLPDLVRATPGLILVPLYHKIRIPFSMARNAVMQFDAFLRVLLSAHILSFSSPLDWDIFLTTVNDFKASLRENTAVDRATKLKCLVENLPRFLWRATGTHGGSLVLDLLFDATDIEQGQIFVRAVMYDAPTATVLRAVSAAPGAATLVGPEGWTILNQLKNW